MAFVPAALTLLGSEVEAGAEAGAVALLGGEEGGATWTFEALALGAAGLFGAAVCPIA